MTGGTWIGVVRHGQSTANVAAEAAALDALDQIDVAEREADVPLSELGRRQASALGGRLRGMPAQERPDVVMTSPFLRARETAEIATSWTGIRARVDERLRDRDLGVLDLHTARGIAAAFPDEAERRRRHGKFYCRPPGGESWTDVALRLRAVLREVEADHAGRRVLMFGHDVVVSLVRYVLEDLDERTLLDDARRRPIGNASLSAWVLNGDERRWRRETFNDVAHHEDVGSAVTAEEIADEPC